MRPQVWVGTAVIGTVLAGALWAQVDSVDGDPVAIAAREARTGWSARTVRTGDAVVFPFGRVQPKVVCAPLRACVIALQAGEVVLGKASGDAERWLIDQTATGAGGRTALIVVKPIACGLVTNLVVSTDRRVYDVSLVSAPCAGPAGGATAEYTRMVRFYYPDSLVTHEQSPAAVALLLPAGDARPEELRFGYRVKVDKHARWAPVAVYDNGVHTYVRLPDELGHGPLPVLRALTDGGGSELMNYAVVGNLFVTDRVLERAELIMADDPGRRVEIVNTHLSAPRKRRVDDIEKGEEPRRQAPLLRGQIPEATRLNRNALLLVMALASLTVLVAVLSLQDTHRAAARSGDSVATRAPIAAQRPVLPPLRASAPVDSTAMMIASRSPAPAAPVEQLRGIALRDGGEPLSAPRTRTRRELADEAYRRALVRAPVVEQLVSRASGGGTEEDGASSGAAPDADVERALLAPLLKGPMSNGGPNSGPTVGLGSGEQVGPENGTAQRAAREHREFLSGARQGASAPLVTSVDLPLSPFELQAGVTISATLVTELNSDLPGTVVAQVSRDMYDSRTESAVLVPRGSRLIGRYDDRIVPGQSRVLVAWTRLLLPDGRSIALPGIAATDARGATGVPGASSSHLGRVLGDAAVLSVLGAGAELSQPRTGGNVYAAPSVGQTMAAAAGTELSTVGTEMVRRGLDVKPTIIVPAGTSVEVLLTDDLVFPGAYVDARG